jgi:hypothetical protein
MAYDEPRPKQRRRGMPAALMTIVLTFVLVPTGYALAERLVVDVALLRMGDLGDQIFTDEPGLGTDNPNIADGSRGGSVNGSTDGLYGGTARTASCNRKKLIQFLTRPENADKAEAWAEIHGIGRAEIGSYINGLTPALLTRDTLVMNHGYQRRGNKGRANPFLAILEAGIAVLVDRYGVPAVRCACGNPLTAPDIGMAVRINYTGQPWGNYRQGRRTVVTKSQQIPKLVLHDKPGQAVHRPVGTDGERDTSVLLPPSPNPPTPSTGQTTPDPTSTEVSPTPTEVPRPAPIPRPTTTTRR